MIVMIGFAVFWFVVEKVKNKIFCRFVHTGTKMILYKKEWHKANDGLSYLLDWVLL